MTERDFDKIFQDKIGDELPFEFHHTDWLAAEQELDKVMPIAVPIAPVVRLLTWHKWAAAAAVLLLASQLFLMSELRNVKQEVVSLHQENTTLKVPLNLENKMPNIAQNRVVQYDTIIKTIIVEVPQRSMTFEKELKARDVEKADFDNFVANQNTINEQYEAGISNKKRQNTEGSSKPNLAAKNNEYVVLNAGKAPLQTVENANKNTLKDNNSNTQNQLTTSELIHRSNSLIDLNKDLIKLNKTGIELDEMASRLYKNQAIVNESISRKKELFEDNEDLIDKNKDVIQLNKELIASSKDKSITNELINKNVELIELNKQLINFNKDKSMVNDLPNLQLMVVKSINRNKNWLNDAAFDFITMIKSPIIKPISIPNGWEIGVNSLFLSNEDHRKPQRQSQRGDNNEKQLSVGANLRLGYNTRYNVRLSAEVDFWSERHSQDTGRRSPKFTLPPDFKLQSAEQFSQSWQIRLSADYKTPQLFGLQPFIGIGLAYQGRSNDEFQYRFKKDNTPLPPVNEPNDEQFRKPISFGIRAGVEGKIYRRLSWSVDVNAQRSTTLSSHIGLKYAL